MSLEKMGQSIESNEVKVWLQATPEDVENVKKSIEYSNHLTKANNAIKRKLISPSGCQRFTTIPLATCSRGESAEWSKYKRKLTKCQVFLDLCNGGARLVPKNSVRFKKSKRKFLVSTDPNNFNYSV